MKYILTISFLFFCVTSKGQQYPITQNLGSSSTLVNVPANGGLQAVFIPRAFADTTSANAVSYVKNMSGAIIRTTGDSKIWVRNQAASQWVEISTGGVGVTTASNGLTLVGSDVRLGGALTANTSITGGGVRDMNFTGLDDFNVTLDRNFYIVNTKASGLRQEIEFSGPASGEVISLAQYSITSDSVGYINLNEYSVGLSARRQAGAHNSLLDVFPDYINFECKDSVFLWPFLSKATSTANKKFLVYDDVTTKMQQIDISSLAPTITASNGLTKVGNDIRLGGVLNQVTTISDVDTIRFNGTGASQRARVSFDTTMTIGRGEDPLSNQATIEITANNELILQGNTENARFLAIKPSANRGFFSFHDNFATGSNYYMAFISNGAVEQGQIGGRSGVGDEFYMQTANSARLALIDSGYGTRMRIAGYSSATNGDVLTLVNNTTGEVGWTTISSGGVNALSAIGASPNANGATITGTTLNLQPASGSFGGVVTTGSQTFAGAKYNSGQQRMAVGSVGTPAVTWDSDLNSGFYSVADGTLSYSKNGVTSWIASANTGTTPGTAFRLDDNVMLSWSSDPDNVAEDVWIYRASANKLAIHATNAYFDGNLGVGNVSSPTAKLHLPAGTTSASTAPLKFTSGSLMTSAEAGAVEFLTDKWYATITTGAARKEITLNDAALTSGTTPVATTNGRLTDGLILASSTHTPTITGVTNVASSTAYSLQYLRVGNTVTVSGKVDVTATTELLQTEIGVSLPIASNFSTDGQGNGGGGILNGSSATQYALDITSDATNDRISIKFIAPIDSSPVTLTFSYTYQII